MALSFTAQDRVGVLASFSLALVSEALRDVVAAETAYREAIRKRPEFVPAFLNLAALLEKIDRSDEARSTLEAALELPMDAEQARAIREAIQSLVNADELEGR